MPYQDSGLPESEPDLGADQSALAQTLRGYSRGFGKQVSGLAQMISHPVDSVTSIVKGLGDTASGAWGNKEGVLPYFLDKASDSASHLRDAVAAGPGATAEMVGENFGPGELLRSLRRIPKSEMVIGRKGMESRYARGEAAPSEIWQDGRGNLKSELSDADSTLLSKPSELSGSRLDDVLHHPELYAAYPELRGMSVMGKDLPKGRGGSYHPLNGTITLNSNLSEPAMHSSLLHEVQHAAQDIEDHHMGTNPDTAGSYAQYMENPGELEARVTQQRQNWSPEQRAAAQFPDHAALEKTRLAYIASRMSGKYPDDVVDSALSNLHVSKLEDPAKVAARLRRGPVDQIIPKS